MQNRKCLKPLATLFAVLLSTALLHAAETAESTRWKQEAANVTITRDDWGIAHIHGKTDADAVFGMEPRPKTTSTASRPITSTQWAASPKPKANPASTKTFA